MKILLCFVLCTLPLLVGCSSSLTQQGNYGAIRYGTNVSTVYDKMQKGDNLTPDDVVTLTRAGVRQDVIYRYMRDQSTVYVLNDSDVQGLQQGGVSPGVITYMQSTPRIYRPTRYPEVLVGQTGDSYFYGPNSPVPNGYPNRRLPTVDTP